MGGTRRGAGTGRAGCASTPTQSASSRSLLGTAQLSISARFLRGWVRSRPEGRPLRGVGAHPAQPACATRRGPVRLVPAALSCLLPPQCLALLCLPILRHSPWLASPPPSWDELQVCVPCARPCVCARCGERAPPPPAGQAFAGRYPARAPRASLAPRMSRSRPRFHRPHWAGG